MTDVAYDEGLATRLRALVEDEDGLTEKHMFGGLVMLLHGNLSVGVAGEDLLVRTDPDDQDHLLREPGVRPFDLTGRPMRGWLLIAPHACAEDEDLDRWVTLSTTYTRTLPPK